MRALFLTLSLLFVTGIGAAADDEYPSLFLALFTKRHIGVSGALIDPLRDDSSYPPSSSLSHPSSDAPAIAVGGRRSRPVVVPSSALAAGGSTPTPPSGSDILVRR